MRLIDADDLITMEYGGIKFVPKEFIDDAPTIPEPSWIPVSERLPETIKPVIVTWTNTNPASYYRHIIGVMFTGVGHFCNGKWYWYSSTCETYLEDCGDCPSCKMHDAIEVIAWMPLPEPYNAHNTLQGVGCVGEEESNGLD